LNIDVEAVPGYRDNAAARALVGTDAFQTRLRSCREARLVDYRAVAELKDAVLTLLFAEAEAAGGEPWLRFKRFRAGVSAIFERHCVHLALRTHLKGDTHEFSDWRSWPGMLSDCESDEVGAFSQDHAKLVSYVAWLQWVAEEQLTAAVAQRESMAVGLYRDLAVGADANGAETWSRPELFADGVHIGSPPDAMSAQGQDWGLPPWSPLAMRRDGYRSFVELLRANMRHAGALRIDHAMALQRLFWVPEGAKPKDGAYVGYPLEDLLGILALESTRAQCIVIGEDLGTVPAGFRERMAGANVLSYRVLMFERDGDTRFAAPRSYPKAALAVTGNHDLPTLRGWWDEHDVSLQQHVNGLPEDQAREHRRRRAAERAALLDAFRSENLLDAHASDPPMESVVTAAHHYIGRTNAMIALAQVDDISRETDPVNVPGASRYPNWRRRLSSSLEELGGEGSVILTALAQARAVPRE
jgi:4-alpha-glucanotransferase